MRDILFKAKQIDTGEWVEGDLIHYESGEVAILEQPFSKYGYEATEISGRTMVDPNTICQYTGLTDKNGNKIWENDICSVDLISEDDETKENCIVRYGRRAENFKIELGFNVEWTKTNYLRCDICFWTENREIEVIGNIFDNAELLEG